MPFALNACSSAKDTLGLTRKAPDEFAVVKRAPLAMPPSFDLPPPRPGAARPQEQATNVQAREAVFGEQTDENISSGDGESLLLQEIGADQADPNIRRTLDAELEDYENSNLPPVKKLLGLMSDKSPATVVNAKAEAERIQKNLSEGKPVTEGETPYIEE